MKSTNEIRAKSLTIQQLRNLRLSTLFLTGENKIIYSVEKAINRILAVAPQIQIKVIKNAGHDLLMAQPQSVNHAILAFLHNENPTNGLSSF